MSDDLTPDPEATPPVTTEKVNKRLNGHEARDDNRWKVVAYLLVILLLVVAVFSGGVVFYAKRANDAASKANANSVQAKKASTRADVAARTAANTTRGVVKVSCVLVRVIEQSADQQKRSANAQAAIIKALPQSDPTRAVRVKQLESVRAQVKKLNAIAADMRFDPKTGEGVVCPPRGSKLIQP